MSVQYHAVNQNTVQIQTNIQSSLWKLKKIIITFYVFINLQFLINRFHRDGESAVTHFLISQWKLSAIWFVQRILTIETTSRLLSKMILVGLDLKGSLKVTVAHLYQFRKTHSDMIPTVKLKIPGKAFLKSESRTSVTFKL